MPEQTKTTNTQPTDYGKILLTWRFAEYPSYRRSKRWYVGIAIVGGALLLWSLITSNYLFAIFVIMVGVILVAQSRRTPHDVVVEISEDGVALGRSFYRYQDIQNFWIAYEPPQVKNLYIRFKAALRPLLSIPLENENPVAVRRALRKFIDEDLEEESETTSDAISRLLKI